MATTAELGLLDPSSSIRHSILAFVSPEGQLLYYAPQWSTWKPDMPNLLRVGDPARIVMPQGVPSTDSLVPQRLAVRSPSSVPYSFQRRAPVHQDQGDLVSLHPPLLSPEVSSEPERLHLSPVRTTDELIIFAHQCFHPSHQARGHSFRHKLTCHARRSPPSFASQAFPTQESPIHLRSCSLPLQRRFLLSRLTLFTPEELFVCQMRFSPWHGCSLPGATFPRQVHLSKRHLSLARGILWCQSTHGRLVTP